jgi:hypothetical protein
MGKGQGLRTAFQLHSQIRQVGDVHTRASFCRSHAISESKYYQLKRQGRAPREIQLGNRVIISEEAAADWRAEREAETLAKQQAKAEAKAKQQTEKAQVKRQRRQTTSAILE